MGFSQRQDFLLRQVKAAAGMLARVAGLKAGGRIEEARTELERAAEQLLGSRGELLRSVDAATAAMLLDAPDRIRGVAKLFEAEAAMEADAERAASLKARAAELLAEAARRD
jgi:hypothetical protein